MIFIITVNDLVKILQIGEVNFSFLKNDNSTRNVSGTLKPELITSDKKYNKKEHSSNYKNVRFFDLEKNQWRSLSKNIKTVTLAYD
jgi:WYL_2, Sm-like SH3 beta-barrel fold